jgi:ribonuclease T2
MALATAEIMVSVRADLVSCSSSSEVLSCHNTTAVSDLCCFNYPGGALLQVQLWDTDPAVGPDDSWTIHGLW